jgi:formiminoglutamase
MKGRGGGREAAGADWQAPDPDAWRGRVDEGEGPRALRWHQVVTKEDPATAAPGLALLGFACEAGVLRNGGRPGAHLAPGALRRALAGLAWHGGRLLVDAGDVVVRGDALEVGQRILGERVAALLRQGHLPMVLGGGHETAFGTVQGLAAYLEETHPTRTPVLGVLNLDAHLDLRRALRPSSGTPFRDMALLCQALGWDFRYLCIGVAEPANTGALFDTAREMGARWILDDEAIPSALESLRGEIRAFLAEVDHLHLSLDLDVLPASVAPGVSAPAARGVDPSVVEGVVKEVLAGDRLRTADVSELSPPHDPDGRTARVAARLVWKIAGGGDAQPGRS